MPGIDPLKDAESNVVAPVSAAAAAAAAAAVTPTGADSSTNATNGTSGIIQEVLPLPPTSSPTRKRKRVNGSIEHDSDSKTTFTSSPPPSVSSSSVAAVSASSAASAAASSTTATSADSAPVDQLASASGAILAPPPTLTGVSSAASGSASPSASKKQKLSSTGQTAAYLDSDGRLNILVRYYVLRMAAYLLRRRSTGKRNPRQRIPNAVGSNVYKDFQQEVRRRWPQDQIPEWVPIRERLRAFIEAACPGDDHVTWLQTVRRQISETDEFTSPVPGFAMDGKSGDPSSSPSSSSFIMPATAVLSNATLLNGSGPVTPSRGGDLNSGTSTPISASPMPPMTPSNLTPQQLSFSSPRPLQLTDVPQSDVNQLVRSEAALLSQLHKQSQIATLKMRMETAKMQFDAGHLTEESYQAVVASLASSITALCSDDEVSSAAAAD
jgi:hypothetical protein